MSNKRYLIVTERDGSKWVSLDDFQSLQRQLKEEVEENGEYWARLKVMEQELENAQAERDEYLRRIVQAQHIISQLRESLK